MKFLLDMGISPHVVDFLQELGHEAEHLSRLNLHRLSDPEIISKARNENHIILTHDLDFGTLMAASGARFPSVVLFRLADMRPVNVNAYLEQILNQHQQILLQGAILSINEKRVRVRQLPI